MKIIVLGLILSSALTARPSLAGDMEVQRNIKAWKGIKVSGEICANIKLELDKNFQVIAERKGLAQDNFSIKTHYYSPSGHRGYRCSVLIQGKNTTHALASGYGAKYYGQDRNAKCDQEAEAVRTQEDIGATGVYYDQGWSWNYYCQVWIVSVE